MSVIEIIHKTIREGLDDPQLREFSFLLLDLYGAPEFWPDEAKDAFLENCINREVMVV